MPQLQLLDGLGWLHSETFADLASSNEKLYKISKAVEILHKSVYFTVKKI